MKLLPDPVAVAEFLWRAATDRLAVAVVGTGVALSLTAALAAGWYTEADHIHAGFAPAQPIPFSHAVHAGTLAMDCRYCHTGVERSRHAGIPPLETCMNCHRVTKTDSPHIREIARRYEAGEPMPWMRVHALPDHAFFDHRPHVAAGVACETCHGPVQRMAVMRQHMELKMGACLACHRNPSAALPAGSPVARGPEHCNACHR